MRSFGRLYDFNILRFLAIPLAVLMVAMTALQNDVAAEPRATEFMLANGMQVVVIPDNRAPVVTHMVWYRVGAADEPPGASGIAHFLEHLMFKSTDKIPVGEFSKIVARMGGEDNAFTSQDATAYFQRIAKDRLANVMEMEADRMVNLRLTEKEVLTERDVILEERRSRIENNPSAILTEQMDAALYMSHPYGIPVIGWEHEMGALDQGDAMSFYERFYAPNNAILVVSGDVTVDEVRRLAEKTYGKIPANSDVPKKRVRPAEPPHRAHVELELRDPRAGKASLRRYYLAPNYGSAKEGEAEALEVLIKVLASDSTSRLYRSLVVDKKIASSTSGWYSGSDYDIGKIALNVVAADGVSLDTLKKEVDGVIADVRKNGITEAELKRAKSNLMASYVYQSDSQSSLARRYGWALTMGRTVSDIESWPDRIEKVNLESVLSAAKKNLELRNAVTGRLIPVAADGDGQQVHGDAEQSRG